MSHIPRRNEVLLTPLENTSILISVSVYYVYVHTTELAWANTNFKFCVGGDANLKGNSGQNLQVLCETKISF